MNALPRLLYILQTASIHVPPTFFKTYKSLCSRFLWGERRPRISYTQLALPKHSGGVGLPELLKYYKAIHLSRISDWDVHASYKDWVNLEASFTDLPLRSLPLTLERHIPLEILSHPLIRPTIQCFCNVCKHTSLSSIPGPLVPSRNASPISNRLLVKRSNSSPNFFDHGKFLSASHLSIQMDKLPIPVWTYLLLTHYIKSLDKHSSCSRQLTPFEMLCTQDPPQSQLISTMHSLLFKEYIPIIIQCA